MQKARLREEILRCGRDPVYFIKKYVKIKHPVRGLIPFETFAYQDKILQQYCSKRFNIILKARQMGISEITSAFIIWLILFHRDQSVLVMSTKSETAKNVVRKVKVAIKNLPAWLLLADITTDNKTSVELSNGSWIRSVSKSQDAGRSEALSLLVIDEAAHIEGFEEIWTGIKPTVTAGGRIIMLSTPNGVGNVFHKTYDDATSGDNDFNAIDVDWWEHPDYSVGLKDDPNRPGKKTSPWFEKETKGISERERAQEYEREFLSSGATFFTIDQINWVGSLAKTPLNTEGPDRGVFVYAVPVAGKRYLATADVARGDGKDSSTCHIFEVETMDHVVEYKGKLPVDEFAALICDLGRRYGNALLVVENNAVGFACLEHVKTLKYPNIYYSYTRRKESDQNKREGEAVNGEFGPSQEGLVAGITTGGNNRTVMLNKLEELVRTRAIFFHSPRFRDEMLTFIWNNGRPEARSGKNDDLVMAGAFAAWIRDAFIGGDYLTLDIQRKMVSGISMSVTLNTQIPGACKDPTLAPSFGMGSFSRPNPRMQHVMRLPNGQVINFAEELGLIPRKG